MAVTVMCSVRDVVAETFGRPFFTVSTPVAVRSFTDELNRGSEQSLLRDHPADFELYELGSFEDQSAIVVMLPQPRLLVRGSDLVNRSKVDPVLSAVGR